MPSSARLILASNSARRQQMLTDAGYDFDAMPSPFDDTGRDWQGVSPARSCEALAWLKATALFDAGHTEGIILAADTIAELDGAILGKPANADQARYMLTAMAGREHQVITAVTIFSTTHASLLFHDIAQVTIENLTDAMITEYLKTTLWQGKAGGYNLGEMQQAWSIRVSGDPTTVMGLPMQQLPNKLATVGVYPGGTRAREQTHTGI